MEKKKITFKERLNVFREYWKENWKKDCLFGFLCLVLGFCIARCSPTGKNTASAYSDVNAVSNSNVHYVGNNIFCDIEPFSLFGGGALPYCIVKDGAAVNPAQYIRGVINQYLASNEFLQTVGGSNGLDSFVSALYFNSVNTSYPIDNNPFITNGSLSSATNFYTFTNTPLNCVFQNNIQAYMNSLSDTNDLNSGIFDYCLPLTFDWDSKFTFSREAVSEGLNYSNGGIVYDTPDSFFRLTYDFPAPLDCRNSSYLGLAYTYDENVTPAVYTPINNVCFFTTVQIMRYVCTIRNSPSSTYDNPTHNVFVFDIPFYFVLPFRFSLELSGDVAYDMTKTPDLLYIELNYLDSSDNLRLKDYQHYEDFISGSMSITAHYANGVDLVFDYLGSLPLVASELSWEYNSTLFDRVFNLNYYPYMARSSDIKDLAKVNVRDRFYVNNTPIPIGLSQWDNVGENYGYMPLGMGYVNARSSRNAHTVNYIVSVSQGSDYVLGYNNGYLAGAGVADSIIASTYNRGYEEGASSVSAVNEEQLQNSYLNGYDAANRTLDVNSTSYLTGYTNGLSTANSSWVLSPVNAVNSLMSLELFSVGDFHFKLSYLVYLSFGGLLVGVLIRFLFHS